MLSILFPDSGKKVQDLKDSADYANLKNSLDSIISTSKEKVGIPDPVDFFTNSKLDLRAFISDSKKNISEVLHLLCLQTQYSCLFSTFSEAHLIRERYLEVIGILDELDFDHPNLTIAGILATLERGDFVRLRESLTKQAHPALGKITKRSLTVLSFLTLVERDYLNFRFYRALDEGSKPKSQNNSSFDMLHLIQGKRVALVGPLVMDFGQFQEYDVLVCLNPTATYLEHFKHSCVCGYLSIRHSKADLDELIFISEKLRAICFFWDDGERIFRNHLATLSHQASAIVNGSCFVRVMNNPRYLFLNDYIPNMLQNAVWDILCFSPKRLKIFGFNGYASLKCYADPYLETIPESERVKALDWGPYGLRLHEPFSNFAFIHNLIRENVIEADSTTVATFNLPKRRYAEILDECCSGTTLDNGVILP